MNCFYVYALFREDGSPFYIGKGSNGRWIEHERRARAGAKGYRFSIIRKMWARGIDVPKIKLHEGLTEEVAHGYEVALIAALGRHPLGPLVNLTDGGEGVSGLSSQTRAKIAEAASRRTLSPETRAKIAAANRGKTLTPEHCAKFGAANRGRRHSLNAVAKIRDAAIGRKASSETRAKMSAAQRGKKHSPETIAKMREARLRNWAAKRAGHTSPGLLAFD